jgi:hypothetical protein
MAPPTQEMLNLATQRLTINNAIRQITNMPGISEVIGKEILAMCQEWSSVASPTRYCFSSAMKSGYHPHPQFFYGRSDETAEQLSWLASKTGIKFVVPTTANTPVDAQCILDVRDKLMELVGAERIQGFVKTSGKQILDRKPRRQTKKPRETCTAKFIMKNGKSPTATKESLPLWANKYQGDYFRALSFAAEFAGRVYNWYDAWLRSQAMLLAKVGLLHYAVIEYRDTIATLPLTTLFLTLASAEFGKRKEFTLEKQKQGGLNPYLEKLLSLVKEKEPSGISIIAYMLPAKEIWDLTTSEHLEVIHAMWSSWMPLLAVALEDQWTTGVEKCARRQMRVLPGKHAQSCGKCKGCIDSKQRLEKYNYKYYISCTSRKQVFGSGINSSLWNVVADAWQNGSRVLRGLDLVLQKPAKFWGKTLQLIASDQFKMADTANKSMDPNVEIFDKITRAGIFPWRVAHPVYRDSFDSVKALLTVLKCCSETRLQFLAASWIGIPQLRKADVTVHHDLICGCVVPPMPQLVLTGFLKSLSLLVQPVGMVINFPKFLYVFLYFSF